MRTVGVEEELLLVDRETGRPLSVAGRVLRRAGRARGDDESEGEPGSSVASELQQQQLETDTHPHTDLGDLEQDLRSWRGRAIAAAEAEGARVVAAGTSPVPVEPRLVAKPRNLQMVERFGLTTAEQLTCGCHVHVSVDSEDEAVGVLDRIRVWLPTLLALSANSPFWQGMDTRYASYRSQVITRWPSAGPPPVFGSTHAYRELVSGMVGSGVLLDEGMIYFDARISRQYPTVEIRVADVCPDVEDAVLIAALCRALVETAARQWNAGEQSPVVNTAMLRLAGWQAARDGVDGTLLDPETLQPRPARTVIGDLVEYLRPALRSTGDEKLAEQRLAQLLARGNGALRQRSLHKQTGDLADMVTGLGRITAGQD